MVAAAAAGKPSGRVDQLQPALIAEQSQQQRATELLYVRNTISERWSQRPYFRQRKKHMCGRTTCALSAGPNVQSKHEQRTTDTPAARGRVGD